MQTMTDKELLELAAKAAGYDETRVCIDDWFWVLNDTDDWTPWNPLADDGDALRLAVKLGFKVNVLTTRMEPFTRVRQHEVGTIFEEEHRDDAAKATRRAIVRAAAEIGKKKP